MFSGALVAMRGAGMALFRRAPSLLSAHSRPAPLMRSARSSTTGAFRQHMDGTSITIEDDYDAREIATRLLPLERELLRKALDEVEKQVAGKAEPITSEQARSLFVVNSLPFVGFGFLDNAIMILAGEHIDHHIGVIFTLSTMAAAAIGNLISDVAGVGLAHYVEILVHKAGVKHPVLTAAQLESPKARWTTNAARAAGLSIGCIIGMFPLLFFHSHKEEKEEEQAARLDEEATLIK